MTTAEENADGVIIDWLLEKDNPSVRYFALMTLRNKPEDDREVLEARGEILKRGVVPRILDAASESGFWNEPDRFYVDKYRGTVWQLMLLAELGCDPGDGRARRACEFILENAQDRQSFGFSIHGSARNNGGRHSEVIPCLTGNMVWSLIRLGFLDDPRVQKGIDWICRYQRTDDGICEAPAGWPYDRFESCWGKHTCHMGAAKALKALSAIPSQRRSAEIVGKIEELAEFFLLHHIHKKSHDLRKTSKPGWLKLGFPLMYQTDILELASILTGLGYRDSRMDEALQIIREKRGSRGRWILENTFNGKMIEDIEEKGGESKWITLKALGVLSGA